MVIEYGAMSSKYSIEAENKLAAYFAMCLYFGHNAGMIAIYSPEECKADSWLNPAGDIMPQLDKIFGGDGAFDRFAKEHAEEIRAAYGTIKQLL